MERTITRKPLTDETLKALNPETVCFVFISKSKKTLKGMIDIFTDENGRSVVYSGNYLAGNLRYSRIIRSFPMLSNPTIYPDWSCLPVGDMYYDMFLLMRKELYPEFKERLDKYLQLPPGQDGRVWMHHCVFPVPDMMTEVGKMIPGKKYDYCLIRHWKTCTEAVMKKLA